MWRSAVSLENAGITLPPRSEERQLLQHMWSSCLTLCTMKHSKAWLHSYDTAHPTNRLTHLHTPIKTWQHRGLSVPDMELGKYRPSRERSKRKKAVFLLPAVGKQAVWNANEPVLYLLVKGISYFLTITLGTEKSVNRNNCCSHTPCKQTRSAKPLGMKTKWICCWGLEAKSSRKENHSA